MIKFPKLKTSNLLRFVREDAGATSIEYAIIAAGVAVAIASTLVNLGSSVQGLYNSVAAAMN